MGRGAPKKVETIPIPLLVSVYAAEGLLEEAKARATVLLTLITHGDETKWTELDQARYDVHLYSKQYTTALARLINSQGRV
jgi:hypothetical protein